MCAWEKRAVFFTNTQTHTLLQPLGSREELRRRREEKLSVWRLTFFSLSLTDWLAGSRHVRCRYVLLRMNRKFTCKKTYWERKLLTNPLSLEAATKVGSVSRSSSVGRISITKVACFSKKTNSRSSCHKLLSASERPLGTARGYCVRTFLLVQLVAPPAERGRTLLHGTGARPLRTVFVHLPIPPLFSFNLFLPGFPLFS